MGFKLKVILSYLTVKCLLYMMKINQSIDFYLHLLTIVTDIYC